ncbi:MAG: Na+/H+ antiporter subunit E [Candidatus Omnitrophica bacterium]|nr:Na+/H+ antiporter subunit E [Candidatus Omnitrophota bacterium]
MILKIILSLLWFAIWMLLSWPPTITNALAGIAVAAFVTFMTSDMFDSGANPLRKPSRYLWFVWYAAVFLWECVKANLDVAYRVIHPDLPIRPGTVKIKTALKSDIGLTFLANSITLTPGTTTVDIDKERGLIYVHRMYIKDGLAISDRLPVVDRFEKILRKVFE